MATGGLAVIGVMIQGGAEKSHPTVEAALSFAPSDKNFVTLLPKAIKAQLLLPASALSQHTAFIHYSGSLTTPPCSEPVDW